MSNFQTLKLWYAKGVDPLNKFSDADATRKIENKTTPEGEEISLIYILPAPFTKRQTDVSNALAADPTSPDTGTAGATVIIRFTQERKVARTVSVLPILLEMFYLKSSDDTFEKGRFGLENTDNPELDVLPLPTAGYKFISFKQEPNQNQTSLQIWELTLKFLGDNTKLGTRTP